jgi:meromycolic acid enoyl-[acyl-carrier protein] reductase
VRAPLGWDPTDATNVGDACVVLFSDLMKATTGDTIHVDGGAHFNVDPLTTSAVHA